jgi:hypothetical protein
MILQGFKVAGVVYYKHCAPLGKIPLRTTSILVPLGDQTTKLRAQASIHSLCKKNSDGEDHMEFVDCTGLSNGAGADGMDESTSHKILANSMLEGKPLPSRTKKSAVEARPNNTLWAGAGQSIWLRAGYLSQERTKRRSEHRTYAPLGSTPRSVECVFERVGGSQGRKHQCHFQPTFVIESGECRFEPVSLDERSPILRLVAFFLGLRK